MSSIKIVSIGLLCAALIALGSACEKDVSQDDQPGETTQEVAQSQSAASASETPTQADREESKSDETQVVILRITGMSCQGCAQGLEGLLGEMDGVKSAKVSFDDETARIECEAGKADPARFVEAIETEQMNGVKMGYEVEVVDPVTSR